MKRFKVGTKVRTLKKIEYSDSNITWKDEARENCMWGTLGKVIRVYARYYKVEHKNKTAFYERRELEFLGKQKSRYEMMQK